MYTHIHRLILVHLQFPTQDYTNGVLRYYERSTADITVCSIVPMINLFSDNPNSKS